VIHRLADHVPNPQSWWTVWKKFDGHSTRDGGGNEENESNNKESGRHPSEPIDAFAPP
jgi:hypothetical protein